MYHNALSQESSVAQNRICSPVWGADPASPDEPRHWLYQLLHLFIQGKGRLPEMMGLDATTFIRLCDEAALSEGVDHCDEALLDRRQLIGALLASRQQERDDLCHWLLQFAVPGAEQMASIIATASMGFNHLWEDLGLASRAQLRELIQCCFPRLIAMNEQNLRWKKFFYRQLCEAQGAYLCRAPSCHACYERSNCVEPQIDN